MNKSELAYVSVERTRLADVLRGDRPQDAIPYQGSLVPRISKREALVIWDSKSRRPSIIGVNEEDREELFSWALSYHRDLSPLTSWCHVLSMREIERLLPSGRCDADLFGFEAAWAGASIAEAMVLSHRGYDSISVPACLATDTFALARTASLYGVRAASNDTIEKLDRIRDRLKKTGERWRATSSLVTAVLLRLLPDAPATATRVQDILLKTCREVASAPPDKRHGLSSHVLGELTSMAPHLSLLENVEEISAEHRVKLLREMPNWISSAKQEDERLLLYFAAGYVISRIGGAEQDLRLAENFESGFPNVLSWAAVLGSLGAVTYWSDAFGGIGRLVARELSRPLHALEAPTADISADEFLVLGGQDRGSAKFRTALRQVATISVRPGVVVQLSISDEDKARLEDVARAAVSKAQSRLLESQDTRQLQTDTRQLQTLAEQLFPFMKSLLLRAGFEPSKRYSRKGKSPQLPLK